MRIACRMSRGVSSQLIVALLASPMTATLLYFFHHTPPTPESNPGFVERHVDFLDMSARNNLIFESLP
jgi:hypothetical protein